ncbi:MAG: hypothetical protein AB1847_14400 [bacterium]
MKKLNLIISLIAICLTLISCGEVSEDSQDQEQINQSNTSGFNGTVHYTWKSDIYKNWIRIEGTVRNDTPIEQDHIIMHIRVRDGNYNILGTDSIYLDPIPAADEVTFTSYIFDRTCPSDELQLSWKFEKY